MGNWTAGQRFAHPRHIPVSPDGSPYDDDNPLPVKAVAGEEGNLATSDNQEALLNSLGSPEDAPVIAPSDPASVTARLAAILDALQHLTVDLSGASFDIGSIALKDGTTTQLATVTGDGSLKVDASDTTQPVSVSELPLPTGAATEETLTDLLTALGEVQADPTSNTILDRLRVIAVALVAIDASIQAIEQNGLTDTQLRASAVPVSVSELPLSAGAATSAKQDALTALVGEVQANPTANTVQDRLKALALRLGAIDDAKESDPDAGNATLLALTRGVLAAIQGISIDIPEGGATEDKQDDTITLIGSLDDDAQTDPDAATASLLALTRGVLAAVQGIDIPEPDDPATETTLSAISTQIGAVSSNPTSNSVQDRLKTIAGALAGTLAISAAALPLPSGAATAGNQTALNDLIGEVQTSPTANTVLDRLKTISAALAGTLAISASSLPLPTGAATSAGQDALAALVGEVQTTPTSNTVLARLKAINDTLSGTLDVEVASLPLPSGAATAAKQDTGNTSLGSLDSKFGEVQASPTANTLLDRLKAIATTLGATLAISAASLPLPAGAATSAKQPALGTAGSAAADVITVQGVSGMTPVVVQAPTASSLSTGQVSVTTSATQILASDTGRKFAEIKNIGSAAIYLGASGVTTTTGHYLAPGEAFKLDNTIVTAAIYGIVATGSVTVTTMAW